MRLRNISTGTIVTVSDEQATRLPGYEPVDRPRGDTRPVCAACGFEAKTAGGLAAHSRTHGDGRNG